MHVFVAIAFLIGMGTVGVSAQLKAPLSPDAEPFSIKLGSTFSASPGVSTGSAQPGTRPSRIAADILEAEAIIARSHINGRNLKPADLMHVAIDGMLGVLDPHSSFFSAAEWREMLEDQLSGYTGIGATIANFERGGVIDTFVLSTFPGSPAARAQLRFGDRVVAINGEKTTGLTSDVVRDKIRGAIGSAFRLTVERAATSRAETVEIRRNRVAQPSIPDSYILRAGIGYIDLSEGFNYTTADEFDAAMRNLKRLGMRSLILDLRGNPGGIVNQAVRVTERFLPAGTTVVTQRGRARIDNRVWRSANTAVETMPLVVLVDENSASASEIVAGAFQDDDRAMIVGEKTFGKGLVQSVIDLPGNTGLTLTTSRYLTPSGRSIQREYAGSELYDYYNHRTSSGIAKPYFEARTITDRRVFGGDGIQPDELVKSAEVSSIQAALLDPLFFFAREVTSGRIAGQEAYRATSYAPGKRVEPGDLSVTDSLYAMFVDFAAKGSKRFDTNTLRKEAAFIRLRLRYNLAMASFGITSANQVLVEDDRQVAKAVETLPRAAELARNAAKARQRK